MRTIACLQVAPLIAISGEHETPKEGDRFTEGWGNRVTQEVRAHECVRVCV